MGLGGKFISLLFLFAAGFVMGYHMASISASNAPIVTLKLVNASGKRITDLSVISGNTTISYNNLEDNDSQTAKFYAPRETSYRIHVNFDDGNLLEAGPRFVEAGLDAIETIGAHDIKPNFDVNAKRIIRQSM
jgi:hypothetical protein